MAKAQVINRVMDGNNFQCQSRYDVFRSQRRIYFTASDVTIHKLDKIRIDMTLNFFQCVETQAGSFELQDRSHHHIRSYRTFEGEIATHRDLKKEIIVLNEGYEIIATSEVHGTASQLKVSVLVDKNLIDYNDYPDTRHLGTFVTTFMLRSQTNLTVAGKDYGNSLLANGSYRLFFDL